jgi:hypothetical protein
MDINGSGSCPEASFGFSGVEPFARATTELVNCPVLWRFGDAVLNTGSI